MTTARPSAIVVGAGLVGLAAARELMLRHPARRVVVLEKEPAVGMHQSGHNSGVVHSGAYYAPGSLRARTCVTGAALLAELCAAHGVELRRCGKVIVASAENELGRLRELHRRAVANGVPDVELIDSRGLARAEPEARGLAALRIGSAASVDFRAVARALAAEVESRGGELRCGERVTRLAARGAHVEVGTSSTVLRADVAVVCAGLQSDRLAMAAGAGPEPRIVPFRGDYWVLRPERRGLVRGHVYPVPDPDLPFLGVHATVRVDGSVWLGPTATPSLSREGYRRGAVAPADVRDLLRTSGLPSLLRRHRRAGLAELARGRSRWLAARAVRRYLPRLRAADLLPGPCGIRAQALASDGTLVDDFVVQGGGRLVLVRNAPSPAATACLAIARLIADRVDERLAG